MRPLNITLQGSGDGARSGKMVGIRSIALRSFVRLAFILRA